MTEDSDSTQPSSSSTGTRPSGGLRSMSHAGRFARSIVTVSYGTPFSARTMRVRAQ